MKLEERIQAFIDKANSKFNNKYDYSLVHASYKNNTSYVKIICPIHSEFEQKPNDHLNSKYGCKKCADNKIKEMKLFKTFEKWSNKANNKFNSKYTYYFINSNKAKIICPIHGKFEQDIYDHYSSKYGCPKCGGYYKDDLNSFINKAKNIHKDKYDYSKVNYVNSQTDVIIICPIHGEFEQTPDSHINQKANCPRCKKNALLTEDNVLERAKSIHNKYKYIDVDLKAKQIKYECKKHGIIVQSIGDHIHCKAGCPKCGIQQSKCEMDITQYINKLGVNYKANDRVVLNNLELDIYLPDNNLAIEYHGVLWHSIGKTFPNNLANKDKLKFEKIDKHNKCKDKNILLFQIFENEWLDLNKQEIWKSMINNNLGLSDRIYARKCRIKEINIKESNEFLNKNHLQGSDKSSVKLALTYNDKIVMVMTFVKPRYNRKYDYEISRICTLLYHNVIGGVSKLLKHFEYEYQPKSIISYANKRWSLGKIYEQLNFKKINNNSLNYYYLKIGSVKLLSRSNFMKNKLENKLEYFDEKLSEFDNMINNDYRILYDAGNYTFIKEY